MENKQKLLIFGILGVIAVVIVVGSKANNKTETQTIATITPSVTITPTETKQMINEINELIIEDLKIGTGAEAVSGKTITVNYSGTLLDGTKFDSSYDRGTPFTFNLGAGEVIEGWDKGFAGMKVGGKRKLTIPSSMAYGERGAGALIPPSSTLVFEVELLKVE